MKRGYMKRIISLCVLVALTGAMAFAAPTASLQRVKTKHHVQHHRAHKAGKHPRPHHAQHHSS